MAGHGYRLALNNPEMLVRTAHTEMLREHPFAKHMLPAHTQALASQAKDQTIAAGDYLWRQGDLADSLYLIQSGQVALEISVPGQGPLLVEVINEGEILGWSWRIAPLRCHFDARALTAVRALVIPGPWLYHQSERDPALGYELLKRIVPLIAQRLESARQRLLDLYGPARLRANGGNLPLASNLAIIRRPED